jgi:hypothetical protein
MKKAMIALLAGLAGGFAIAAWWPAPSPSRESDIEQSAPGVLRERLEAVERQLQQARRSRNALAEEIDVLRQDLGELRGTDGDQRLSATDGELDAEGTSTADRAQLSAGAGEIFSRPRRGQPLAVRLAEAGFTADRAQWIDKRMQELQVEAMQARFGAARDGVQTGPGNSMLAVDAALRDELGDREYEQFLEATSRPTHIDVGTVLTSSAAEEAGMLPGDQIVAYAGERVYNARELNQLQLDGEPGEPVVVDVIRDGSPIQLVLPRGPVGITTEGFRGGRGPR